MTTLLPDELREIRERDAAIRGAAGSTLTPAMMDRGKLLRHCDAIAERLGALSSAVTAIQRGVKPKDHKVRAARYEDLIANIQYDVDTLLADIRGESDGN